MIDEEGRRKRPYVQYKSGVLANGMTLDSNMTEIF